MKHTGAEILVHLLERQGVDVIAGVPGGANLPIYNALHKSKIRHVLTRHEQGAGFIAQGIARSTGKVGVCFASSGPGATNLVTAIADAKLDSIPIIAITGQVGFSLIGTDAFQEVDTYGMTIPITKHNFLVRSARELLTAIPESFRIALSGRPGPVVIDIPKNVQNETIEFDAWPEPGKADPVEALPFSEADVKAVAEMIKAANRPVLYVGGGIIHSGAEALVKELADKNGIPLTWTLMGAGVYPVEDPKNLGMLGMHGSRATNLAMREADLLLAFGVRFDDRATGNLKRFCENAKIVHVDIDRSEIHKNKKADYAVNADIKSFLASLVPAVEKAERKDWLSRIATLKKEHPFKMPLNPDHSDPLHLLQLVSQMAPKDSIITTDVGQHQMWTAQVYPVNGPRRLLTSGGLGTMGFGFPAAIGAAIANPDKRVICFSGDGSIQMNIQEMATLADLGLNVTVIVMNNEHLGLVRQQQELFYNSNYIASKFVTNPDFAAIARGYHLRGVDLRKEKVPLEALRKALNEPGPWIVDAPIHSAENVFPMVPPGAGNDEMIGG